MAGFSFGRWLLVVSYWPLAVGIHPAGSFNINPATQSFPPSILASETP